jgi:cephalosporin-C deacetylase-like acetyl esterase
MVRDAKGVWARQAYVERTLLRELGGLPERTPLHAEITGSLEHPDYTVQKLVYQSLPGFYVTADVYVPKNGQKPYPAVLGVAGHSPLGKAFGVYQTVWVSLARRGILVLAIDPVGQGERLEHLDPITHKSLLATGGTAEHMSDGLPILLTGTNIARYFVWDGMRGIDYLQSREDVDKTKIGVAGNSGGGTQSAYLSALDKRIGVSIISCYLSAWDAMWHEPGPQDSEQVFDHFLADHLDYADFLSENAPRPAEMEVATHDFFPIAGARATFQDAKHTYDLLGKDDHIGIFEAEDNHGWSEPRRVAAYTWLSRWLLGSAGSTVEAPVELDRPPALAATSTGQVMMSYPNARTLQSLNAALAQELRAKPFEGSPAQLAKVVRQRLGLPTSVSLPAVDSKGSPAQGTLMGERMEFHTEIGITVPGMLFLPKGAPSRRPAILSINPAGMMADVGPIQKLVDEGNVVLSIDPRGWGESAPPEQMISGYHSGYQLAMHAILVGKSVAGMQTLDLLSAFRYLSTRPEVDPKAVSLRMLGYACNVGLFAAAVERRIGTVVCDRLPISYVAMTQLSLNNMPPEVIVPGILQDFDLPDVIHALGVRFRVAP